MDSQAKRRKDRPEGHFLDIRLAVAVESIAVRLHVFEIQGIADVEKGNGRIDPLLGCKRRKR
jgi:hypothetical protein